MQGTHLGSTVVSDSSLLFRSLFHNSFRTVPKGAECESHTRKRRKNGRILLVNLLPGDTAAFSALDFPCSWAFKTAYARPNFRYLGVDQQYPAVKSTQKSCH